MSSPALPPNKRRRVTLACSLCRRRKSRCSGDHPCALCQELGAECQYPDSSTPSNLTVGRSYIAQLEQRLQDIESSLQQLHNAQNDGRPILSNRGDHDTPANESLSTVEEHRSVLFPSTLGSHDAAELGEIDISENSIDGMGAMKFTNEEDCGFFGPSSNIAFMRYISRAILQAKSGNELADAISPTDQRRTGIVNVSKSRPPSPGPTPGRANNLTRNAGVNIYALPSEERTWSLIQQYFLKTGQLLPFIHEPSFCKTYLQMKNERFRAIRRTWLGLLNIILAIAASLSAKDDIPVDKRIQESDIYYQRANGLCDRDSKRNASLEMVQYLLILGQYLQGTQKSVQAWTTHGLAISAAYQLGLHSPDTNQGFSPLECEIRKRTWYGCILLDRTLSMTFGRPCTIPESYIKLDMPLSHMQMLGPSLEMEPCPQLDGAFFTAAIKLYTILYNVLDSCYGQNLGFEDPASVSSTISRVFDGQHQLDLWRLQLIPSLSFRVWDTPMNLEDVEKMDKDLIICHRFSIVLSVRYNNLRILLHRRHLESLLKSLGTSDDNSGSADKRLLRQMSLNSVESCVESAISIISIVHCITLSSSWRRELLGAWNYSLYYTFNAALVIFASLMIISAPKEPLNDTSVGIKVNHSRPYIENAIEALRQLDSGNRVIERCVEYLAQLSLILNAMDRNESNPSNSGILNFPVEYSSDIFQSSGLESYMDLGEFMVDGDIDFLADFLVTQNGKHQT
ncbi:fungal-specific transcription factor domain-containing protein [Trichoderma asperelloides]|nr:fungal-specific transcription factor domain-containing protein [Trichoderma asperelloides]